MWLCGELTLLARSMIPHAPMIPHAHRRVYDLCARHMNEVASENISEVSTRLLYAVGGEFNAVLLVLTCL